MALLCLEEYVVIYIYNRLTYDEELSVEGTNSSIIKEIILESEKKSQNSTPRDCIKYRREKALEAIASLKKKHPKKVENPKDEQPLLSNQFPPLGPNKNSVLGNEYILL